MDRRVLLPAAAPGIAVGAALTAACLVGVFAVERMHDGLTDVLDRNVAASVAAQDLALSLRQLRFHAFENAIDPGAHRVDQVDDDCARFEIALARARTAASSEEERLLVEEISRDYVQYRDGVRVSGTFPDPVSPRDLVNWIESHRIGPLITKCTDLLELNRKATELAAHESESVTRRTRTTMLLLGVGGSLGGLLAGFLVAREVSRSILRAEQLAAVGHLAAGLAHEIRNPLTAVKLLAGMALRSGRPGLTTDDLRVIHREVERVEGVVQGLLDFARPAAANRRPGDLREIVAQAVDLARPRALDQGVEIVARLGEESRPAQVDAGQIAGAVGNLLRNALDAMPGGGTLEVALTADRTSTRIAVRDTGPGIAPDVSKRLFTPFASTKATGTGLGLILCRRVAEGHGGSVVGGNRPGGGAEFVISVPAGGNRGETARGG